MSKGIGKLQRDILGGLTPETEVDLGLLWAMSAQGHAAKDGKLAGVYDLRRVARQVADRSDAQYPADGKWALPYYPTEAYSAAFCRAVRSLIKRGLLEIVHLVDYRGKLSSQARFVRVKRADRILKAGGHRGFGDEG